MMAWFIDPYHSPAVGVYSLLSDKIGQECVKFLMPSTTSPTKSLLGAGHPNAQNTWGKPL
jgi:hypothetical protein